MYLDYFLLTSIPNIYKFSDEQFIFPFFYMQNFPIFPIFFFSLLFSVIVRAHQGLLTSPTCRKNGSFQLDGHHPLAIAGKFNSLKVNKKESKETLISPPPERHTPLSGISGGSHNNQKQLEKCQ